MAPPANLATETQRKFGKMVVSFVTIGFLAVLGAAIAAAVVVIRAQNHATWVAHSYEVSQELEIMSRHGATMRAEALTAAFFHRPKSPQYEQSKKALFEAVDHLAVLTADNPKQQQRIPILRQGYERFQANLDPPIDGSFDARMEAVEAVRMRMVPLRAQMAADEKALLASRQEAAQTSAQRFWIVLPLAGILLIVVAVASVLAIRRFTGELAQSRDELAGLNEGLEEAVQERTRDLQRANEEIQRFAYIVSHDLRSPLVNVMGFTAELDTSRKYLEKQIATIEEKAPALLDNDAKLAAVEDLPEAIGFIRSSTQRMDRLINAILRLSREGRRTLTPETLDTTAIVQNAIDAIRHKIDDAGATAKIEGKLPAVVCDRIAFEQILGNLIENATKYLKPGRAGVIRVKGHNTPGRAVFEVIDNGRGIDPHDHERIFDLFRRSGVQDQPGEGIGLAHVRALAHRLGGTVDVASELGEGATFRVTLPVMFAGDKDKAA